MCRHTTGYILAFGVVVLLGACSSSGSSESDEGPGDMVLGDPPPASGILVWQNQDTKLVWEVLPADHGMIWVDAITHCDSLSLDGFTDWRLPTIDELRSLVRGCPASETGGACRVSDSCLSTECLDDLCLGSGCEPYDGPAWSCYWPTDLRGNCDRYWSSSPVTDNDAQAWFAMYDRAWLAHDDVVSKNFVRCVR